MKLSTASRWVGESVEELIREGKRVGRGMREGAGTGNAEAASCDSSVFQLTVKNEAQGRCR